MSCIAGTRLGDIRVELGIFAENAGEADPCHEGSCRHGRRAFGVGLLRPRWIPPGRAEPVLFWLGIGTHYYLAQRSFVADNCRNFFWACGFHVRQHQGPKSRETHYGRRERADSALLQGKHADGGGLLAHSWTKLLLLYIGK